MTRNELINLVNGKILYHGSNKLDLEELIPPINKYKIGSYLTSSKKVALSFGEIVYSVRVSNIRNPFIINAKGESYNEIKTPKEMIKQKYTFIDEVDTDLIADYAYKAGYDSAIILNVYEGFSSGGVGYSGVLGNDFILFDKNQMEIISQEQYKYSPHKGVFKI